MASSSILTVAWRRYLQQLDQRPLRTKAEAKVETSETIATGVQTLVVTADEAGMRVDRFLVARFPQLPVIPLVADFTQLHGLPPELHGRLGPGRRAVQAFRLHRGQRGRHGPQGAARLSAIRFISTVRRVSS